MLPENLLPKNWTVRFLYVILGSRNQLKIIGGGRDQKKKEYGSAWF
jgi:hypothetical protein